MAAVFWERQMHVEKFTVKHILKASSIFTCHFDFKITPLRGKCGYKNQLEVGRSNKLLRK